MFLKIPNEVDKSIDDIFKSDKKHFYDFLEQNNIDITNDIELKLALERYEKSEDTKKHKYNIKKKIYSLSLLCLSSTLLAYGDAFSTPKQQNVFNKKIMDRTNINQNISMLYQNLCNSSDDMSIRITETIKNKDIVDVDTKTALEELNDELDNNNLTHGKEAIGESFSKSYKEINEECDVDWFRWCAKRDHKTRSTHAERNGKRFDYYGNCLDGKISDGRNLLPGEDYNCRCWMEIPKNKISKYAREE